MTPSGSNPSSLAERAAEELASWDLDGGDFSDADIERVTLDVRVRDRHELVSVRADAKGLVCSSTDGNLRGEHVRTALRWIAGRARRTKSSSGWRASGDHSIKTVPLVASERVEGASESESESDPALVAAIGDLATAVLRTGSADVAHSVSVEEALRRLVQAMPNPPPVGFVRWVGRLRASMVAKDSSALIHLIAGAQRIARDLEPDAHRDSEAIARLACWFGSLAQNRRRVEERKLLEIARELVSGFERASVEQRYFVDLENGDVYVERQLHGAASLSVGPCPRLLSVGLAEAETAAQPSVLRLYQYVVSAEVDKHSWTQLFAVARRRFEPLLDEYRDALKNRPGLSELFAVVAPTRYEQNQSLTLFDEKNLPLRIARGAESILHALGPESKRKLTWIAGTLTQEQGALVMTAASAGFREGDHSGICRVC